MDYSMLGFPVLHYLPKFAQTHVHWVSDVIQPSSPLLPSLFSSCLQSFPASGSISMSQLFESGGQSTGASASASVLPVNIQDWFPLSWLVWSLCSARDSQESSPAPQFETINSLALIRKASSDNHFAFLNFFFFGMVLEYYSAIKRNEIDHL